MNKWLQFSLVLSYSILFFLFSLYSYSQIDLNLTISPNPFYQGIQSKLILLGYYHRPMSAVMYLSFLFSLFAFYLIFLKLVKTNKTEMNKIFILLLLIVVFFSLVSYPAFSHDFFNYLFDARIITKYGLNPYQFRALDFPDDLWVRFMHWTHRTYPYGPLWLITTLPFSFIGAGKFVLTVILFKFMFVLFYLANIKLIWKITKTLKFENASSAAAFFAFNPLTIIETLISPHNESLLLTYLLLSVYFLIVTKKNLYAYIFLLASIAVKFVTLVLVPLYPLRNYLRINKWIIEYIFLMLLLPLSLEIYYREAYPWYFIPLIGLAALSRNSLVKNSAIALAFGSLLRYVPYLYTGEYNPVNYQIMNYLLVFPLIIMFFSKLISTLFSNFNNLNLN